MERAVELEMPAMALVDRNGVYGSARFHTSAKRNDDPGACRRRDCCIRHWDFGSRRRSGSRTSTWQNPLGFHCSANPGRAIRTFASSSRGSRCARPPNKRAPRPAPILQQYASGLVCLTGGDEGPLAAALMRGGEEAGRETVERLVRIFGPAECLCRAATASGTRGRVAQPSGDSHRPVTESPVACDQRSAVRHHV